MRQQWLVACFEDKRRFSDISAISRLRSNRKPISEIVAARPGIKPLTSCSARQELNHYTDHVPVNSGRLDDMFLQEIPWWNYCITDKRPFLYYLRRVEFFRCFVWFLYHNETVTYFIDIRIKWDKFQSVYHLRHVFLSWEPMNYFNSGSLIL